jgi:hypothetical protein
VLAGTFEHPLLSADPGSQMASIDFNTADLTSLIERLDTITDPRRKRGVLDPSLPMIGPASLQCLLARAGRSIMLDQR